MSFLKFNDEEHELQIYNPLFNNIRLKNIVRTTECGASKSGNKPKIFCIDGNIGSGKSTVLDSLANRGYTVFKENLEEWMPALTLFYDNPKRWMFTLQVGIVASLRAQYDDIYAKVSKPYIFVERCPLSALLFVKTGIRNGNLTYEEIDTFTKLFNQNFWSPDRIFYIDTPVDTCFYRSQVRDRECEKSIKPKYLQQLNDEYVNMYRPPHFTDICTIDGSRDVQTITDEIVTYTHHTLLPSLGLAEKAP
jgi:deoxyadenosine/deoxycytidine kinase